MIRAEGFVQVTNKMCELADVYRLKVNHMHDLPINIFTWMSSEYLAGLIKKKYFNHQILVLG